MIRDGVCAARDRAENAAIHSATCPDSAAADVDQIDDLIAQARRAAPSALSRGDLTGAKWDRIDGHLTTASAADLGTATSALGEACALTAPCPPEPRTGCRSADRSKILMRRLPNRTPNADALAWSWTRGAATTTADFGDPSAGTDYAVCVYAGASGNEKLVYESGVPASSLWASRPRGFRYADRRGGERGVRRLVLKSGPAGKSEVTVRATGTAYSLTAFAGIAAPVTAQLVDLATGTCFASVFGASDVQTSDDRLFKARSGG